MRVEVRKAALSKGIVDHTASVEQTQADLEQVGQGRDCVEKAIYAGKGRDEGFQHRKERVQDDEAEASPLYHHLLALAWKQADQRLNLGKPQKQIADDPPDLDGIAGDDLGPDQTRLVGLGVDAAAGEDVLALEDGGGLDEGDGQTDAHGERGDLLEPWAAPRGVRQEKEE